MEEGQSEEKREVEKKGRGKENEKIRKVRRVRGKG